MEARSGELWRYAAGYGDDYRIDEDGELVCNCLDCPNRPGWWDE